MASEAGKGSGRRPTQVSAEAVASNWDRIFGKKKENATQADFRLTSSDSESYNAKIPGPLVLEKSDG